MLYSGQVSKPSRYGEPELLDHPVDGLAPHFDVLLREAAQVPLGGGAEVGDLVVSRPTMRQAVASRATGSLLATTQPKSTGMVVCGRSPPPDG